MKRILCLLACLSVITLRASDDAHSDIETAKMAPSSGLSGFVSTGVESKYIGRIGAIFSDKPISVNIVEIDYKDFYLGTWNATGLTPRTYGTTYADEWDAYGGWAHDFGPVKVDLSGSYFGLAQLDQSKDDMWIAEQEVSFPKFPFVQPYVRSRYFGSVADAWKPGWFVFGGVRKSIELGHGAAKRPYMINLDLSTAYSFGALHDYHGFVYGRLGASLDIPLSKRFTFNPNMVYQVPVPGERSDPNGFTDRNEFVFGATLKWIF